MRGNKGIDDFLFAYDEVGVMKMSKEWLALLLGVTVGSLFSAFLWLLMPDSQNTQLQEATLYYHQVGIYANATNAQNASASLEAIGLDSYTLEKDGNAVIICGLVLTEEESAAVEATLQGAGMPILEKQESISAELKQKLEAGDMEAICQELESR